MFEIKAKVDYGLLIMIELAQNQFELTPLSVIAKRMGVSSAYLSQIASGLIRADLIKSKEGTGGGYSLVKPARQISVLEIVEALEGEIKLTCVLGDGSTCPHSDNCQLRSAWSEILPDLKNILKKRNLASLLKK